MRYRNVICDITLLIELKWTYSDIKNKTWSGKQSSWSSLIKNLKPMLAFHFVKIDRALSRYTVQWFQLLCLWLLASYFGVESLTTVMCLKNHITCAFTSSPTHRYLNIECAKETVYYVGIADHGPENSIRCNVYSYTLSVLQMNHTKFHFI